MEEGITHSELQQINGVKNYLAKNGVETEVVQRQICEEYLRVEHNVTDCDDWSDAALWIQKDFGRFVQYFRKNYQGGAKKD